MTPRLLVAGIALLGAASVVPPAAANQVAAGTPCTVQATDVASSLLFNDPGKRFGIVTSAWTVTARDVMADTVHDVTITCTIQSVPAFGSGGASRSSTTAGGTGQLTDSVSYVAVGPVFVCTTVEWNSTKGHTTAVVDADGDSSNGIACPEVGQTGEPVVFATEPWIESPALGYIAIEYRTLAGQVRPAYTLSGALGTSAWNCSDNFPSLPYQVSCEPASGTIYSWNCDVLHVDASGQSAAARVRTTMDCDNGGAPEAQSAVVVGAGYDGASAVSNTPVVRLTCTVDGGSQPASPDYYAGCGDPGLIRLR